MDADSMDKVIDASRKWDKRRKVWLHFVPADPVESVVFMSDLAAGLLHLHQHNFVHRDIKSPNALLRPLPHLLYDQLPKRGGIMDQAQVADCGLARRLAPGHLKLDNASAYMGTVSSMAPEVLTGRCAVQVCTFSLRADCCVF